MRRSFVLIAVCLLINSPWLPTLQSQNEPTASPTPIPEVPDLAGLTLPQAAATLAAAGLRLGTIEDAVGAASAEMLNTISEQTPVAGTPIDTLTAVDVRVQRDYNIEIIYDGNDLNLRNLSGIGLNIRQLELVAADNPDIRWSGTEWNVRADTLNGNRCVQLIAERRLSEIEVDGCNPVQNWQSTAQADNHFWRGADGSQNFVVIQDGIVRATCPTTNSTAKIRCQAYLLPGVVASDTTPYAYFVYDDRTLFVVNRSTTAWMPVHLFQLSDEDLLSPAWLPSDQADALQRLAPGHCIRYNTGEDDAFSPPDCAVTVHVTISEAEIFWQRGFVLRSRIDNDERQCPPITSSSPTICLVPR